MKAKQKYKSKTSTKSVVISMSLAEAKRITWFLGLTSLVLVQRVVDDSGDERDAHEINDDLDHLYSALYNLLPEEQNRCKTF